MNIERLKALLDEKTERYNRPEFIETDPILIPKDYSKKEDVEISGFITAAFSWGQRVTIINNAKRLMRMMDNDPYSFILNHKEKDLKPLTKFVHRTFNGDDCLGFISGLKRIYLEEGGLESAIVNSFSKDRKNPGLGWKTFKDLFFESPHLPRTRKHLPDPTKGSAAKRMNMFLRWMVRKDENGVDFGLWNDFDQKDLYLPLDVHTGRVARELGLLTRKQNDWKSVLELTNELRKFDRKDPVKYDFALFGMGIFENKPTK